MPKVARKADFFPDGGAVPIESAWSGDVHGPVAALHQAIESGLSCAPLQTASLQVGGNDVVEGWLRLVSRITGWTVLAVSFAATLTFIF